MQHSPPPALAPSAPPAPPETPRKDASHPASPLPTSSPSGASTRSLPASQKAEQLTDFLAKPVVKQALGRSIRSFQKRKQELAGLLCSEEPEEEEDDDVDSVQDEVILHFDKLIQKLHMLGHENNEWGSVEPVPLWISSRIGPNTAFPRQPPIVGKKLDKRIQICCTDPALSDFEPCFVDLLCSAFPITDRALGTEEDKTLNDQLEHKFKATYKGEDHLQFDLAVAELDKQRRGGGWYAACIPVPQSSGTGKSRLFREVSKIQPMMSFCFREPGTRPAGGFPLCDEEIMDFLTCEDSLRAKTAYDIFGALLGGSFKKLGDHVDALLKKGDPFDYFVHLDMAGNRQARKDFLQSVVVCAREMLRKLPSQRRHPAPSRPGIANQGDTAEREGREGREAAPSANKEAAAEGEQTASKGEEAAAQAAKATDLRSTWTVKSLIVPHAKRFFETLAKLPLKSPESKRPERFYFVFDECTALKAPEGSLGSDEVASTDEPRDLRNLELQYLRSLFASFDDLGSDERLPMPVWAVFLDTSSSIWQIAPPTHRIDSARARTNAHHVRPFVFTAFDRLLRGYSGPSTVEGAYHLSHLKMFGRPLWGAASGEETDRSAVRLDRDNLALAEYKLFPEIAVSTTFGATTGPPYALLAILGHRVCLDLIPVRSEDTGGTAVATMVSRHMRCVVSISDDSLVVTRAKSEPMLSIAAMRRIFLAGGGGESGFSKGYEALLTQFKNRLAVGGPIDYKGANGEFICRLLVTMAVDMSIGATGMDLLVKEARLPALSVDAFMRTLLGSARWDSIRPRLAADKDGLNLDNCWINVTHLALLKSDWKEDDYDTLKAAWLRSTGLQCPPLEPGIDGLLPVYCGDVDQSKPGEGAFSYISWQSKLCQSKQSLGDLQHCMHGPLVPASHVKQRPGLFTLLFDLAAARTATGAIDCSLESVACKRKGQKRKAPDGSEDDLPPRTCQLGGMRHDIIHVCGVSVGSLPFLGDENAQLLGSLFRPFVQSAQKQEPFSSMADPANDDPFLYTAVW